VKKEAGRYVLFPGGKFYIIENLQRRKNGKEI